MSELQATLEFSVELHKFYNVDLFQRGFYQVRCNLKSSPKVPSKVEVSLPRTKKSELIFPPSIINGVAVSKTFQILYRNEEVSLDDVIHYRVHIVLDSARIEETLTNAEFSLEVELWFSEDSVGMEQHSSIQSVSKRNLLINFVPTRGLHHHLPVLFDYFHLSSVSVTIHAGLISIHQPYLPSPRSANKRSKSRHSSPSTMETVLFGQAQLGAKYGTSRTRLAIACRIYQEVCTLLLQSLESLQLCLQHLSGLIPDLQRPSVRMVDCRKRMKKLIEVAQALETEEDFLLKANSDISQLCAENILLWNKFLDSFTLREVIRRHLAQINHSHRVRRFSEGFFTMTNPRKSALCCLDAKHQHYMTVSEAVRKSQYFSHLPNLAVSCVELDGASESLPIIFEDVYCDGVPKRNSMCEAGRMTQVGSHCVLVTSSTATHPDHSLNMSPLTLSDQLKQSSSSLRPSSVPVNLNIGLIKNNDPRNGDVDSLDKLDRDLSILVEQTMTASISNKEQRQRNSNGNSHRKVKKKISLPIRLSDERLLSSTLPLSRSKSERKRSMDSSVSKMSPTLSPDMKIYFKEKLKTNLRLDSKLRKQDKIRLKQSPSLVEPGRYQKGLSGYSHLECCSNIPYNLEEEPELVDGMRNPKVKHDHEESFTSAALNYDLGEGSSYSNGSSSNGVLATLQEHEDVDNLQGMAKVRDIVLRNSRKDGDCLSDSSSEASGWVSNNSRRSSFSTTDTSWEQRRERSKAMRESVSYQISYRSLPTKKATSRQQYYQGDSSLRSPGLILTSRSRSEEPGGHDVPTTGDQVVAPVPTKGRPRHRSECSTTTTINRSYSPVRKFAPPHSPASASQVNRRRSVKDSKHEHKASVALSPPAEFRDPVKLENVVRENNFARVRKKVVTQQQHEDVKVESEVALQKLYEAVNDISVTAAADKKMSRSNTISFGDETINLEQERKESSCEMRQCRKLVQSDSRMSSSLQSIDRRDQVLHQESLVFTCTDWVPNKNVLSDERMVAKIGYIFGSQTIDFLKHREEFKRLTSFPGALYSDRSILGHTHPYFTKIADVCLHVEPPQATHLIVCVHGLDGNSADLRLIKTYMEMALPGSNLDFLMSEINQMDTFLSFEDMTKKLVTEILYHIKNSDMSVGKISFVGHSLGCILIRAAIQTPELVALSSRFHTYLSLSGPHLGTMYNNSNLVNAGMWVMQRWKKSGSLQQLAMKDSTDIRQTFMYKLSANSNLHLFKNVLLTGSSQDKYVPIHSARIELCKAAIKDNSVTGAAYKEMVDNILGKVVESDRVELVRYDVHHALPNNTNSLIGRAAHIAVLDSELFIEKFLTEIVEVDCLSQDLLNGSYVGDIFSLSSSSN